MSVGNLLAAIYFFVDTKNNLEKEDNLTELNKRYLRWFITFEAISFFVFIIQLCAIGSDLFDVYLGLIWLEDVVIEAILIFFACQI